MLLWITTLFKLLMNKQKFDIKERFKQNIRVYYMTDIKGYEKTDTASSRMNTNSAK